MPAIDRLLDLALRIQQIPAPTFSEEARGNFAQSLFLQEALEDVSKDSLGNVYARLPGRLRKAKPLVVSAHLDTVFPAGVNLQARREEGRVYAPGIGDNSLGVAALFGILWTLREKGVRLEHDLWLVADTGEEGLGDLRGMRAVAERFGADVVGYLALEGLAFGHVYHRAVGVRRYRVTVKTAGGHSWADYGMPSAVHELAAIVTALTSIRLPRRPRATLNVGTIQGGMGVNVLAPEARCELDLRSEEPKWLEKLTRRMEKILADADREGARVTAELIGERPAGGIPANHPLVTLALQCLREQGEAGSLTAGSTDANIPLSRGIPAVVMGISTGGGAHTLNEYVDIAPMAKGLESAARFVELAGNVSGGR